MDDKEFKTRVASDQAMTRLDELNDVITEHKSQAERTMEMVQEVLTETLNDIVDTAMLAIGDHVELSPKAEANIRSNIVTTVAFASNVTGTMIGIAEVTGLGAEQRHYLVATDALEDFEEAQEAILTKMWEEVNS